MTFGEQQPNLARGLHEERPVQSRNRGRRQLTDLPVSSVEERPLVLRDVDAGRLMEQGVLVFQVCL